MKKILGFLIVSAMLAMLCAPFMTVSAFAVVGNVNLNYGTVAIDGNFSAGKWAAATPFTVDASNAVPWTGDIGATIKVYGLWDEAGLYLGGEVIDPTFVYSTGAYNGDGLQFSLGLGQVFQGTGEARCIFYSFGCYENPADQILVRQESENNGDVADGEGGFLLKTKPSAAGWTYEMFMPWSMLNEDLNLKVGKTFTPAAGAKIDCLICYIDNSDEGMLGAWGSFTSEEPDWGPEGHGVVFVLQAKPAPAPEPEPEPVAPPAANEPAPAEPAPAPAPAPVAPVAPPTGDLGMILAVLASVAGTLGFAAAKKAKAKR